MKAAIITLHTVCNYGTVLQTYATQEKMKQFYDEVVFIDYRRKDTYGFELLKTFSKGNVFRAVAVIPTLLYWKHIFGGFIKKNINLTEQKYLCDEDFENFQDCADVYFVGSDQVWNTGWNGGILAPFYLHFVPNDKPRYAFASSFGMEELSDDDIKASYQYLKKFEKITVRENSGLHVLREQYKYQNVERILDPTLTMPAEFWRKHTSAKNKIKNKYILIYNLNRSKEFDKYAQRLSQKTGYPIYRLCTRLDQIFRNGKSIIMPEVFEFISLIDNAQLVLTDSFHATAFSMNMNTEPICVYPEQYAGRISEFLQMVEAEQRHLMNYDDFDVVNRHVDFKRVNEILDIERKKVEDFLMDVIHEEEYKDVRISISGGGSL